MRRNFGGFGGICACFRILLLFCLACLDLHGATRAEWQGFRAELLRDKSVIRYYDFGDVRDGRILNQVDPEDGGIWILANSAFGHPRGETWRKWQREVYPRRAAGRWLGKGALRSAVPRFSINRARFYGTPSGSFTLEAWICVYNTGTWQYGSLFHMVHGYKAGWRLEYNKSTKWAQDGWLTLVAGVPEGSVSIRKRFGSSEVEVFDTETQYLWHQVVVSWDEAARELRFCVDGELVGKEALPEGLKLPAGTNTSPENDLDGLCIGGKPFSRSSSVDFKIDELVVYDRVLSLDDVAGHYRAGCPEGTKEERLARVRKGVEEETAVAEIGVSVPAKTYGYFVRGERIPVTLRVPGAEWRLAPAEIQLEVVDAEGQVVPSQSRTFHIPQGTNAWAKSSELTIDTCGVFRINAWVLGAEKQEITQQALPLGIVRGLPDESAKASDANPLGALSIMAKQPECVALGFGYNRIVYRWGHIERKRGELDWSRLDELIGESSRRGLGIVLCFTGIPSWLKTDGSSELSPADMARYRSILRLLVNRYSDQVRFWEIWDAPNYQFGSRSNGTMASRAENYVCLLRNAYEVIHREDPAAKVIGIGARGAERSWLGSCVAQDALKWVDIVSFQRCAATDPNDCGVRHFVQTLTENREERFSIWNTNGGCWQFDGLLDEPCRSLQRSGIPALAQRASAGLLVRDILRQLGEGVSRFFLNKGPSLYYPGFNNSDGDPSLQGIACANLTALLLPSATMERVESLPPEVRGIRISSAGRCVTALFTDGKPVPHVMRMEAAKRTYNGMDLFGNDVSWESDANGDLHLDLSPEPIYVFE